MSVVEVGVQERCRGNRFLMVLGADETPDADVSPEAGVDLRGEWN